jgi:prepilin-type N-terminal cleavage/methylation domain-containing protein
MKNKGFTLIELLVVVAIIGILSSVVLSSLNTARGKARISKAQAELGQIAIAINLLANDTGLMPSTTGNPKTQASGCSYPPDINEVYLDIPAAGINSTDGNFPGWNGPYMKLGLDPWGNSYWYDEDYNCTSNAVLGCSGAPLNDASKNKAVVSSGPNGSVINSYDSDDIVKILCSR